MPSTARPSPSTADVPTPGHRAPHPRGLGQLAHLRHRPRFLALMVVLIAAAAAVGAREVTRVTYATDTLGGEAGIGVVAVTAAVTMAIASIVAGRIVDRFDARWFLVGSLAAGAPVAAANAWWLAGGTMPVAWLMASTALDAATVAVSITSLLKVQAATVGTGQRGTAESINIARAGFGVALGTMVAGVVADPVTTLTATAVAMAASAVGVAVVLWSVAIPHAHPHARPHATPEATTTGTTTTGSGPSRPRPWANLVATIRAHPQLRRTATVDLVLAAVLPTQFIALVVADKGAHHVITVAFTASLVGTLVGRLALVATGVDGNPGRRLRLAYGAFALLCAGAAPTLVGGWILDQPVAIAAVLGTGSALMAFAQNLPVALLQQQVPDAVRGTFSGAMNAARNVVMAVSAAALTVLALTQDALVLTVALVVVLVAGWVGARGFRGLGATPETAT